MNNKIVKITTKDFFKTRLNVEQAATNTLETKEI